MKIGLLYGLGPPAMPDGFYDGPLAQVTEADRVGLDFALFEEDRSSLGSPGVASLAAAAAARTSAIRVGSADLCPIRNHPVRVAEDWAIVDLLSRGRAILGVAAGEPPPDVARDVWVERFGESLELIRLAWTQDSFQYVGRHLVFPLGAEGPPGWRAEPYERPYVDQWRRGQVVPQYLPVTPKPSQLPHPRVWVSAHRREEIEGAARRGWSCLRGSLETEDELRERVRWYREALEASGRDVAEIDIAAAREVFVAGSAEEARRAALPSLLDHIRAVRAEANPAHSGLDVLAGIDDPDKLLDTCAIVGSAVEVVDRLKQLQSDTGLTHVACRLHLPGREHAAVVEAIRLLASQVATRMAA